jgi:hypothetical protein
MTFVTIMLILVGIYLAAGFVFAVLFVTRGVTRVDEGAHGSGPGFRIIILPGAMVFWPLLLRKWIKASKIKRQ